jgi:hypothetical protein
MTQTLTQADILLIKKRIDKGYFSLAKVYGPFLVALIFAFQIGKRRVVQEHITASQFQTIYLFVFGFFFAVFALFCFRDYRKKVLPFKKELSGESKIISTFIARKYYDPIYRQFLLYHPTEENKYILLSLDEYNSITDGQEIELHAGKKTGIILAISVNGKIMEEVEGFTFSGK